MKPLKPIAPMGGQTPIGVVVSPAPIESDMEAGEPLNSALGKIFKDELAAAGCNINRLLIIPALDKPLPDNWSADSLAYAISEYGPRFAYELPSTPTPTLCLGSIAWRVYSGGGSLDSGRGFIRTHPNGSRYIATWSPYDATAKNPYRWGAWRADINRFARLVSGSVELPPDIQINCTVEQVKEFHANLLYTGEDCAVDIETGPERPEEPWTGKAPTRAKLRSIAFGTAHKGISIHYETASFDVWQECVRILTDHRIKRVYHNGYWFDLPILARVTGDMRVYMNVEDTRDLRRSLSSTSELSLRYCTSLYTDFEPWKENESKDGEKVVFTKDPVKLQTYNAKDSVVTSRVYRGCLREPDFGTKRVKDLYNIHQDLSRLAAKMHARGIQVDESRRKALSNELTTLHNTRKEKLLELVGQEGWTPTPNNMRSLIYRRHKKPNTRCFDLPDPFDPKMWTTDERDLLAVDKNALIAVCIDPNVPDALKEIIEAYWLCAAPEKARSTFVDSERVLQSIGRDSRLRAGWNSCGTETMRWSCSEPNLMNIPDTKKEEDFLSGALPSLRDFYVSGPGRVLVNADWSQQELRMMRAVSGDKVLGAALDSGNVYEFDARIWFNLPKDFDVKGTRKDLYKGCKIIHLASQYAAGLNAIYGQCLQKDRKFQYKHATALHNSWKKLYSDTVAYWHEEHKRVQKCGYSEGRLLQGRRYYPREPPITETANYPIQRTAGEMTALAMLEIDRLLQDRNIDGQIVAMVHDSIMLDVAEDSTFAAIDVLQEVMAKEVCIGGRMYGFPIEVKVGKRWSEV